MRLLVLILLLNTIILSEINGQAKEYSLKECIDYALENSYSLKNSRLDIEASLAEIGIIRSAGLPQVNGAAGLNYNYELRKSRLPASTFIPSAPPEQEAVLAFGTNFDGDMNVGLSQMVFDGSYFVGLQAAKMYKLYSEQEYTQSKINVVDAVTKSYYLVLINEVRFERIKSNSSRLEELLKNTQAMYESGFAEKIDVNRIQVNYNNLKAQENQMERLNKVSKMMLKMQIGMDQSEEIALSEKLDDLPSTLEKEIITDDFNYTNRIDYQLLQSGKQLQLLDIKNYKVQYLPSLDLVGAIGSTTNTNDFGEYFDFGGRWLGYSLIGLKLNVPIFDGFRKSYSIQKSKIELEKIENNQKFLESSIDTEIQRKKDALANGLEMMDVQKQNFDLATELYETTNFKYQEGLGSNLEVIEANNSLIDAQAFYFDALYDAVVAKADLEKALGLNND
jgi:outer membrane protein TolC